MRSLSEAPRKPLLAFAICAAILLVPLAVSSPQGAPRPGKGVLLAAGASPGTGTDVGAPADDAAVAPPTDDVVAIEASAGPSLPAPHRSVGRASVFAGRGPSAAAISKAKGVVTAAGRPSAAVAAPAAPPPTSPAPVPVAAAKVSTAAAPAPRAPAPAAAPAPAPVASSAADAVWDRLAQCESSNTNDPSAPYYGYWQFSAGTWHSVGEQGLPNGFSREHQLAAAKRLQAASGWAPWPDCSRRLGLR